MSLTLQEQLTKEINAFYLEVNEVTKEVARNVMKEVLENTVVDTSQAISNWELQLDTPNKSFIDAHFQGSRGSTAEASESESLSLAEANLATRKLGQDIFITNNIKGEWSDTQSYDQRSQVLIAERVAVESADKAILIAQSKLRNR